MKINRLVLYGGLLTTLMVGSKLYKKYEYNEKFLYSVNYHILMESHDSNVVAHRGFSSLYVENSMESIINAFDFCCVDEVEIDIRLTKDNEIVLMHNKNIKFNCNDKGIVEEKSLEELKQLDYYDSECIISSKEFPDEELIYLRNNENFHNHSKIITLNEVLDEIDSEKFLIIDVKINNNEDEMIEKLGEILEYYNGNLNIKIQSSNQEFLEKMKEKNPNYDYQIIISNKNDISKYIKSDYDALVIKYTLIDEEIVEESIKNNKKVYVWTVNNCEQYSYIRDKINNQFENVTIVSDNPDVICYLNNCNDEKIKKLKNKN